MVFPSGALFKMLAERPESALLRPICQFPRTVAVPDWNRRKFLPLHAALNLAHIALETGRTLHFDADKWECTGDKDATKRLSLSRIF